MSERIIHLVYHHASEFIPEMAKKGFVQDDEIFFRFGIATVNYSFLWDKDKIRKFTTRINNAIQAYQEGKVVAISEKEKKKDYICQVCDNLIRSKCKLEQTKTTCSF